MFTPLAPPHAFGVIVRVEFFAIHSAIFLGMVALVRPQTPHEALGRKLLFWGLAGIYVLGAFSHGILVGLGFLGVLVGTNVGMLMTWRTPTAAAQLVARWIVTTPLFVVAAGLAGMPRDLANWDARGATFVCGAVYFLATGALEASGLFLRAVPRWAAGLPPERPGDFREKMPRGMRELFAATGKFAEPWLHKVRERFGA